MHRLTQPRYSYLLAAYACSLAAGAILLIQVNPGIAQDYMGRRTERSTLEGRFLEWQRDFNRLIFRATEGDSLRTYSVPLGENVQVWVGNEKANLGDLREGTPIRVWTMARGDRDWVVAIYGAGKETPAEPKEQVVVAKRVAGETMPTVLAYPTGDRNTSALLVEAQMPEKIRVGQTYKYQIKITNLTKNLNLENIHIIQKQVENFTLESSEPKRQEKDGQHFWVIEHLPPGQTKTITVNVVAEKEGDAQACIRVKYEPTLCLVTQVVKPEIDLTKKAPREADLCNPFTFTYTIKNTGTAAAKNIRIHEDLPKGLKTTEGKNKLDFQVGDLEANQSRDFKIQVVAESTGDYSSRAIAEGAGELKVKSEETNTVVRQVDLKVSINGESTEYINQPINYTVTVHNAGEAPARNAMLKLKVDPNARVIRAGKIGDKEARRDQEAMLMWDLGTLKPGDSKKVDLTISGASKGKIKLVATAMSECARDIDEAKTQEIAFTEVITLPALLLAMVDNTDPVPAGKEFTYTVTVVNQGSGADENVKVKIELPQQLKFLGSDGPTEAKADGQTVHFSPVKKMEPGEKAVWTMRVEVMNAGDIRTRAELTSDYLQQPAISVEPTRLLQKQ